MPAISDNLEIATPHGAIPSCSAAAPAAKHGRIDQLRVVWYMFFPGGGIGRYTHEVLGRLAGVQGVDAELVCLPQYEWLPRANYRTWPELREIGHPNVLRRKVRFLVAQIANPSRLWRRAREQAADVVHLSNINHLSYPLWSRSIDAARTRVVATAHDVRRAKPMLLRSYEDRQLKRFYQRADGLFVHSRAQLEDLIDFAGVPEERIHIVPHGPYNYGAPTAERAELRRRLGWPLDKQIALFFGILRDDKNLETMLRAMPPHRDGVHLVVAGRSAGGAQRSVAQYRELVEQLGLTQHVTFDDRYIGESEIPDLFAACDWTALPYTRSFTSQSGVLNVAASYRRPVLLSATPTFVETLGKAEIGVLAEPDDIDALSQGIGEIVAAVRAGRRFEFDEYERQFGWEANVRITCDVYRALCG